MNIRRTSIGLAALAFLAGSALGQYQDQRATGRALERDLRVGGTGNVPRADFGAEVRFRNSLITGNAPNGASFRGSVGYRDSFDFRESLPSDQLYRFRRDSLSSGLGGMGMRGTESLQYQFSLSTGAGRAGSRTVTSRLNDGAASPSSSYADVQGSPASRSLDIAGSTFGGALRSTSAYTANRALAPVVVGMRETEGGTEITAASNLLGVRRFTPFDPRRITTPESEKPLEPRPSAAGPERAVESRRPERIRTAYDDLQDKLLKAGESLPKLDRAVPETTKPDQTKPDPAALDRAKPDAGGTTTPGGARPTDAATPRSDSPEAKEPTEWQKRMEDLSDALRTGLPTASDRLAARGDRKLDAKGEKKRLDRDTILAIRKAGEEKTTTLIPATPASRDIYAEQMKTGQELLVAERYFDAEERFAHALSMRGGDVPAMLGRLNAQIGSGLFVSAAVNLKTLVTRNPDAAGMRLAPGLLPSAARQQELLDQLRLNLTGKESAEWRVPKESALLLAYLGFQQGELKIVREGLDAFAKEDANKTDQRLHEFLRGVWLGEFGGAGEAAK